MAKKKHSYKETKAFIKRKAKFAKEGSRHIGNITDRRAFQNAVRKANFKTFPAVEKSYEKYTEGYINARMAWDNTALNMRQWAVIKRYYDLVAEGKIQPRFHDLDNYEKYAAMEEELSIDEMKELTEEAEIQSRVRMERLNRKAKNLTEESMASFEEGARMLGLINFG